MTDHTVTESYQPVVYRESELHRYLENVLQLEAAACKGWLTNRVDRSATGKITHQQYQGELQLSLSDLGAIALDYRGKAGIATPIGHAPQVVVVDPAAGSVMAIAELLTSIVFAPLTNKLESVSLSANQVWPCRNEGEDARLCTAVQAASDFACSLGINVPAGKDFLSITQKYSDGKVIAPGTIIISAGAEVSDIKKIASPVVAQDKNTYIYYVNFSFDTLKLGSSAFAQVLNKLDNKVPTVRDPEYFHDAFNIVQDVIEKRLILTGHDISAGGMITALLEMCFANIEGGLDANLDKISESNIVKILFAENPGISVQVKDKKAFEKLMEEADVGFAVIAKPTNECHVLISKEDIRHHFDVDYMHDVWYRSSYKLDVKQSGSVYAGNRFESYKMQLIQYKFHKDFTGKLSSYGISADCRMPDGIKAAIIREKGTRCKCKTAYALYLAGFNVEDVHMTGLASGHETLKDVSFAVFCGGFSNFDVLDSAKGWTGGFLCNEKAEKAVDSYCVRRDTLSMGICNGCQLMTELGLVYPEHEKKHKMIRNDSHKLESNFTSLETPRSNPVIFGPLSGTKLGVQVAHDKGRFEFPYEEKEYNIIAKCDYDGYPASPNGSPWSIAGVCSKDSHHLTMVPHPRRMIFPWQCGYYPADRKENDEITLWIEAFVNARKWIENNK